MKVKRCYWKYWRKKKSYKKLKKKKKWKDTKKKLKKKKKIKKQKTNEKKNEKKEKVKIKTWSGSHKPPDEYFGRYESGFFFSRFHLTEFNIKVNLNQS